MRAQTKRRQRRSPSSSTGPRRSRNESQRRIVRTVDRDAREHAAHEMIAERRRLEPQRALLDQPAQRSVESMQAGRRAVLEQRSETFALVVDRGGSLFQFSGYDLQHVARDLCVKGGMRVELRHGLLLEEIGDRGNELNGGGAFVEHGSLHQSFPSISRSKSSSTSVMRRPIAARSTEGAPPRCVCTWCSQITPQRTVPNSSQKRTVSRSTAQPLACS